MNHFFLKSFLWLLMGNFVCVPIAAGYKVDFNGDNKEDVFLISNNPNNAHRPLLSSESSFQEFCGASQNELCGVISKSYLNHPATLFIPGDFDGNGRSDILIISGDVTDPDRILLLSQEGNSSEPNGHFEKACEGLDNSCGFSAEDYMRNPMTRIIPGYFNNDNMTDVLIISGDANASRRTLLIATGSGFTEVGGCTGQYDGACGFDTEAYMFHPQTRIIPGNFNADSMTDILVISGDPSFPRRALLMATGSGFSEASGCIGEHDGACGFDTEMYMFHPQTKIIAGNFNVDGMTDILVVSGDSSFPRRALLIATGSSFSEASGCIGQNDGACGFDTEPYMFYPYTKIIPGNFNVDGMTDILVVSGDPSFPRRALLIATGSGFSEVSGCIGQHDGACGFDTEPYMFHPLTKIIPGDYNGDNKTDVMIFSGDIAFPRRAVLIATGSGFSEVGGCIGQQDGACGLDGQSYVSLPRNQILPSLGISTPGKQYASTFVGYPDITLSIQWAIDSGASEIIFDGPTGTIYVSKRIDLRSDLELSWQAGVILEGKSGSFAGIYDVFLNGQSVENISLMGSEGSTIRMLKHEFSDDEWRHTLSLESIKNIKISGLTFANSGGDGIYLGTASGSWNVNENIFIDNIITDNNSRNGLSVISADGLTIQNSTFKNTQPERNIAFCGPAAGIDLEPNNSTQRLVNVEIKNNIFENNRHYGILVVNTYTDTDETTSISIHDNTIFGSSIGLKLSLTNELATAPEGYLEIENNEILNSGIDLPKYGSCIAGDFGELIISDEDFFGACITYDALEHREIRLCDKSVQSPPLP